MSAAASAHVGDARSVRRVRRLFYGDGRFEQSLDVYVPDKPPAAADEPDEARAAVDRKRAADLATVKRLTDRLHEYKASASAAEENATNPVPTMVQNRIIAV